MARTSPSASCALAACSEIPLAVREFAESERERSVLVGRPLDAVMPARAPGHAEGRQQIEATIAVLPFAVVGGKKIPPGTETNDVVVVPETVPTGADGTRSRHLLEHLLEEHMFRNTIIERVLRPDSRDQTGTDRRRLVDRRRASDFNGITDGLKIQVGSDRAELRRPIAAAVRPRPPTIPRATQRAEGLEIEPEDGLGLTHVLVLSIRRGGPEEHPDSNYRPKRRLTISKGRIGKRASDDSGFHSSPGRSASASIRSTLPTVA